MADEWKKELERLGNTAAKRRDRAKELVEESRELIREAQERRSHDKLAE